MPGRFGHELGESFEDDELPNRSYFKWVTLGPGSSTGVMDTSKPDTCGSGIEGARSEVPSHHRSSRGSKGVDSIMVALIVVVVVVLLAVALWAAFNGLIKKRNRTQEAWSEIDVELKRRHDLIPNLVTTVKGYAAHEQGTFKAVTEARANAVSAGATDDPAKIAPAENVLTGALRSLFAVAENYPQLRAVESFLQLQEALTSTEDKIEYARRYYNTSARDYDIKLQTFPHNLIAGPFGFKAVAFFAADDEERAVPQLDFSSTGGGAPLPTTAPENPPLAS